MRRTSTLPLAAAATIGLALGARTARAQLPPLRLELHGGVGTTVVDHNKWSGYPDASLSDWNTTSHQFYAQIFGTFNKRVDVGLEYGWQYFWWYTYIYVITVRNYRTIDVSASHAHVVVRLPVGGRWSLEGGVGGTFFDAGTDPSAHAALGYTFPVAPRISVPIQARADAIFSKDGGTMMPINLTAGVAIRL